MFAGSSTIRLCATAQRAASRVVSSPQLSQCNQIRVAFSTQSTPAVSSEENVATIITDLNSIKKPGEFLSHLYYKGRKNNPKMALRHLRNLLVLCQDPIADLPIAEKSIQLYHRKKSDFSTEVCSRFINLCVQSNQPMVAARVILQPNHRLGAWLGKKSMFTLLQSLHTATAAAAGEEDEPSVATMLGVAEVAASKGLKVQTKLSIELLLQAVTNEAMGAEDGDEPVTGDALVQNYDRVLTLAQSCIADTEIDELVKKYPREALAQNAAADTATVEEGEEEEEEEKQQ